MAIPAAPMMNGARRLTFDDSQTAVQMEIAAKTFGGTVNLENEMLSISWFIIDDPQLCLPIYEPQPCNDSRLKKKGGGDKPEICKR